MRIAVHLATGFEEIEAISIVDVLRRASIDVTTVSITDKLSVTGSHKIDVLADKLFSDIDYTNIDGIILPGGMPGATNLAAHAGLRNEIIKFNNSKKMLGAICAAPLVFGQLGILKNVNATCYPSFEKELTGANCSLDRVVVDGHITTSRGPGTVFDFALTIVAKIKGDKTANDLRKGMLLGT